MRGYAESIVETMKKVTLQDIANSLGISRTTVWKVFNGHEGVSDNLREKVIDKAQELNYKFPEQHMPPEQTVSGSPVNIAVAVCRPETSIFWMTIIHHIAKELAHYNVNLVYTYLPFSLGVDYTLPAQLTNGSTHGMIIMNAYDEKLIRLLAAAPIPKVFLDTATNVPLSDLNGDLILMENRTSISKITEHLISQGRRHFGFIGDINYAKSNYERYEGFTKTLAKYNLAPVPEFTFTDAIGVDSYKEEIEAFLDTFPRMPDAIICANDHVACILMQLLQKKNHKVPKEVAVSGFDANTEYPLAEELTTVQVFNPDIGLRLAVQILYRIKHPTAKHEVTYINTEVIFRNSTEAFE